MNTYSHSIATKSLVFFLLSIISLANEARAQTPIQLDQAIRVARQSNRSVMIANQAIEIEQATFEQSKGQFLPYFGVHLTDIATNNPLNVFGFKLQQEAVSQTDFAPAVLNDPDIRNHFNLSFNAMMPLINPEARAEQDAVKSKIKMMESMAQRTAQGIELEVIKSYYTLLLTQNARDVLEDTHQAAKSNYEIANNYYEQGLMLKSDLLDMDIMVNQSSLALGTAQMNVDNAQTYFNHVLNTEQPVEYQPTDSLMDIGELSTVADALNPNRADFAAMQHGINAMENMAKAADRSFLPKLKAFGSFELNDEIPFENNATNFQVGVTLGWDIYKGNMRKSTINKTQVEIAQKQMLLQQNMAGAELEILKTQRAIADIKSQIELHDMSILQAEEALTIRKNRFEQGLEKSTDIINAETQVSHKKLARLNALFELNIQHAYLKYLLN